MDTIRPPASAPPSARGWCAAIGMFDGVHLGHQHVISAARNDAAATGAKLAVVTFDPHPLTIVNPERAPRLIQSLDHRLRSLASAGVDAALVMAFDRERAAQTAEAFVHWLAGALPRLRSVSVGQGFHFGQGRAGNVPLLRSLGAALDFSVNSVAPLTIGGEVVSSSAVRRSLAAGQLKRAAELLGRPYTLAGVVVEGDRLARRLGFPTANLRVAGLQLPPNGVYAGRATVDGAAFPAAVNIGHRPTVAGANPALRVEAHLLGYEGDLYGRDLEVLLIGRLRDERRFPDVDALRQQIARDVEAVRVASA